MTTTRDSRHSPLALGIMKHLMALKDQRLIDPFKVKQGLPLKGDAFIEHDIELVTRIKALVHQLPLRVYKDEATRQYLLEGIQALLDQLIDREDELLLAEEEE